MKETTVTCDVCGTVIENPTYENDVKFPETADYRDMQVRQACNYHMKMIDLLLTPEAER